MNNLECFFSYTSSIVFIIGIVFYTYYLIIDYKDSNGYREPRPTYKMVWMWIFYIMLFCGFFLTNYCMYV